MATSDRTSATSTPSIQCSPAAKAKYQQAADILRGPLSEAADMAADLLLAALENEETPEQRRARILGKSKPGPSRVRVQSDSGLTAVGQ